MIGIPTPYTPPSPSNSETCTGAAFAAAALGDADGVEVVGSVEGEEVVGSVEGEVAELVGDVAGRSVAVAGARAGGTRRQHPGCALSQSGGEGDPVAAIGTSDRSTIDY